MWHSEERENDVAEPMSDKNYESEFEFPLWKLIREHADKKDISYRQAAVEMVPEYMKQIRYDDTEFEDAITEKDAKEAEEGLRPWKKLVDETGKRGS